MCSVCMLHDCGLGFVPTIICSPVGITEIASCKTNVSE